jgi:tetratricopeptide (TPR) repeat protein
MREIESLIDSGQYEETVAHCRYILQTFAKHIDTYRLLGKVFLESKQFSNAADILQRVLSAVPDDFVSQLGMSIIREDEGNLDAAIWHMERAFESKPANKAIQEELRRLFGRRDGVEPPKIRLTRGALARMYSKGNLYDQAIAELRGALSEDPQRPDLLLLLAQMNYLTGNRVEAVETSSNLLKKFPYCLVANRILALILPHTDRSEDAKVYQQRAIALDLLKESGTMNNIRKMFLIVR